MPGPGTAVVIVQREGGENIPRVGRMTGRAGSISAEFRQDLPAIRYDDPVVLLARVANQKMMAAGVYTGPKDGQDSFRLTGAWSPSDNRRDPRLPVQVKAEVRPLGVRATLPIVIKDLSAGGARVEMPRGSILGEVDLIVRYGGFSATLPAFVLEDPSSQPALAAVPSSAKDPNADHAAAEVVEEDTGNAPDAEGSASETPGVQASADAEDPSSESGDDGAASVTAEATEPTAIRAAAEADVEELPLSFAPPSDGPVEYRLRFGELNLPQQGFLRHMLRDLAEISGWELAS